MSIKDFFFKQVEKTLKVIPGSAKRSKRNMTSMMAELEGSVKPYKDKFPVFTQIPATGRAHADILRDMEAMRDQEENTWKDGYVSGAVYHGDQEHIDFLNQVYALNSQSNPLHADVWPERHQVRGRDRRHDRRHAGRGWTGCLRHGHLRRHGKHPAGDEDLSRLGACRRRASPSPR